MDPCAPTCTEWPSMCAMHPYGEEGVCNMRPTRLLPLCVLYIVLHHLVAKITFIYNFAIGGLNLLFCPSLIFVYIFLEIKCLEISKYLIY